MVELSAFRLAEGCDCGCGCDGAVADGDGEGKKKKKKGKGLDFLEKLEEAMGWGATARRSGGAFGPRAVGAVGGATATRNYGGDNAAPRPGLPLRPKKAKVARVGGPVKRWDGTTKRPSMGGAVRRP